MSTSWIFNATVSTFLLPPLSLILLCAFGLALHKRRPRLGLAFSSTALLLLTFFSTEGGARLLVRPLEAQAPPLASVATAQAQAIVLLAGGRISHAPEYGGQDVPNLISLGRIRYAARLQRQTGLPLLVSGGAPDGAAEGEAVLMAKVLREEFGVPVRWVESRSADTAQNARYSAQILQQAQVSRILLVTDALHMARARRVFAHAGLQAVPAPTVFYSLGRSTPMCWLPSGAGLRLTYYALHEWLGLAWYWLRDY